MPVFETSTGYEKILYKDADFPIRWHLDHLSRSLFQVLTHWHEEIEILYFIDGRAKLICNQDETTVGKGNVVFISPYCLHRLENISSVCTYHCLVVNLRFIPNTLFSVVNAPISMITSDPKITSLVTDIIDELHQKAPWYQSAIQGELILLISLLSRTANSQNTISKSPSQYFEKVRQAIEYIHEHFQEKITVQELCSLVNLSKTYFSQCFQKITGKSIVDYINHYRCECAYHLIQSNQYSISECALMSGFQNLSYFTRKYSEIYGVLPSDTKRSAK